MKTSCIDGLRGVLAGHHQRRIIAARLLRLGAGVTLALGLLVACTATRFAYNQAPTLSYWWIDRHADLDALQAERAREDVGVFFQWHRRHALPSYAELLRHWQAMALADVSPDQACEQFETIRLQLERAASETVGPFARLALTLSPAQLEHLKRRQGKSNEEFEKDFLRGSPQQRLSRRLDKAVDRSESFYGALSTEQRKLLRGLLQQSPFDPQRALAERLRRQADLLQTVRDAQATPAKAEQIVREHIARLGRSPAPGYSTYSDAMVRAGCAQFAALHGSATPEQRANAVRTLKRYEDDLRTLSAQR
ncbi:DUF6279 family lipoprotein [Hydrogenophaga sp. BPS33]|uniref:DUF6279 family lipoprotein n=1 Tax=Hydrogenophaga sp. BPS33 TaxID=2651974 RepID=UPI00131FF5CC|nr:DUF6279 family lipoprotein [Hydrogenophaga sp. BPS33]QHE84250.1 hypothetical protein F9K07_04780 [Hydrogenophaga sp. BPS33]